MWVHDASGRRIDDNGERDMNHGYLETTFLARPLMINSFKRNISFEVQLMGNNRKSWGYEIQSTVLLYY